MKKILLFAILLLVVATTVVMVARKDTLTIHLMQESHYPTIDITVIVDGVVKFQDSVRVDGLISKKISIEDLGIGFHEIIIKSEKGNANYEQNDFHLFNKTMIATYYHGSANCETPCFDVWRKFGKFLAD